MSVSPEVQVRPPVSSCAAAAPVTVRPAAAADAGPWDAFVRGHADGTAYHLFAWRGLLETTFGHRGEYLVAERAGRLCGVLPLAEVRSRLFGHSLSSLPFCPYAGPIGVDEATVSALVGHAERLAQERRVAHLELRGFRSGGRGWPVQDLYVTFRREIGADDEANMKAIPRKQRAMVRKGIANGLEARVGDLDVFHRLYADNVHRHGTPGQSRAFFERLCAAFGDDAEVLVVHDASGAPVSGVVSLYFRDEVLPFYAGDTVAARDLAANDFKYWQVMCRAAARGCRTFDFGRSKQGTGPWHFKKNWGFEPTPLVYEYRLLGRDAVPQNNPLNPKYRLMIETWRRLPRPVVGWLGPRIVGGLG